MSTRYTVRAVTGAATGAGMFQVWDGYAGQPCGTYHYWRDDAEDSARSLNDERRRDEPTRHIDDQRGLDL